MRIFMASIRALTPEGVLFQVIFIILSGSAGRPLFIFLSFKMVYHFYRKNTPVVLAGNKVILRWLYTFNILLTSVLLATVFRVIIPTIKNSQLTIGDILLGGTILLICLHLFVRPQILYGLYQPISQAIDQDSFAPWKADDHRSAAPDVALESGISIHIEPADQLRFKTIVDQYFKEKKPYLNPEYSLDDMVYQTKIPRYLLSAFINREYGMGFREFLNRYRVSYFKDNLQKPEWTNLTLEAIGQECGFNSRSTFISNFKKITGQTPSEYINTVSPGRPG